MKIIFSILSKEFIGYFKNYTAYIILSIYLLLSFAATFYSAYFFDNNNSNLISFFIYQPEILNIVLPALTMKMWADERRHGTIEVLLTLPISIKKFVYGKYLAAFVFSLCMLFMVLPFVFYSSFLLDYDVLNLISAFSSLILVVAMLCAIGCLVSSFNHNAIISYISTVFCGWLLIGLNFDFIFNPLKTFFPLLLHRLYGCLNFHTHYQNLIQGQLGFDNVIYFTSIILLALWLNIVTVEHRKS